VNRVSVVVEGIELFVEHIDKRSVTLRIQTFTDDRVVVLRVFDTLRLNYRADWPTTGVTDATVQKAI
jgi:hypothetical protein